GPRNGPQRAAALDAQLDHHVPQARAEADVGHGSGPGPDDPFAARHRRVARLAPQLSEPEATAAARVQPDAPAAEAQQRAQRGAPERDLDGAERPVDAGLGRRDLDVDHRPDGGPLEPAPPERPPDAQAAPPPESHTRERAQRLTEGQHVGAPRRSRTFR